MVVTVPRDQTLPTLETDQRVFQKLTAKAIHSAGTMTFRICRLRAATASFLAEPYPSQEEDRSVVSAHHNFINKHCVDKEHNSHQLGMHTA